MSLLFIANHNSIAFNAKQNIIVAKTKKEKTKFPQPTNSNNRNMSSASRVLFIGNLSYFCEEHHLFELFAEYGCVEAVRVVQNVDKNKSLMYGFVTMSNHMEACQMVDLLNGHLFMGRNIKVELSSATGKGPQGKNRANSDDRGVQIHVSFYSFFDANCMVLPTELFFRKVFLGYGKILDIVIKDYVMHNVSISNSRPTWIVLINSFISI